MKSEAERKVTELEFLRQSSGTSELRVCHIPQTRGVRLSWRQLFNALLAHRYLLLACMAVSSALITIAVLMMKPVYEPVAQLEIDPPGSETFSLEATTPSAEEADYLVTQVALLKSDKLALDIIRKLHLDENTEMVGTSAAKAGTQDGNTQVHLEGLALKSFRANLNVELFPNSRLVTVKFASHDPKLAADVVNTLLQEFIESSYQTRYEAIMNSTAWLTKQLEDVKQKVEQSDRALADYEKQAGILDVDDKQNVTAEKLNELSHQLTQAQADTIQLESSLKAVRERNGDPEFVSQMGSPNGATYTPLFQTLVERYADARTKLAEAKAIYGDKNPKLQKLQNQVDEARAQVEAEQKRMLRQLEASYASARYREAAAGRELGKMNSVVNYHNEAMVKLNVLKRDAQANAELYNKLFTKIREAGIAAASKSTNARIVAPARVLESPTRPNRKLYILLAMMLGAIAGIMLVLWREAFDDTLRSADDVRIWTGLPSVGLVPKITNGNSGRILGAGDLKVLGFPQKFVLERPTSPEAEAVRSLHTSIMLSDPKRRPRVILIASSSQGEGKTTMAVNLAMVFARNGPTCLIDADMRLAKIAHTFRLPGSPGLSEYLSHKAPLKSVLSMSGYENLMVIPAGAVPAEPTTLINSPAMKQLLGKLAESVPWGTTGAEQINVVIDSPPLLPFADARVLSTMVDGVVLVARYGLTNNESLRLGVEVLQDLHAPILGVVINAVNTDSPEYQYYKKDYGGTYSARVESTKRAAS